MVVTRRSVANASTTNAHSKPNSEKIEHDLVHSVISSKQAADDLPATPTSGSSHTALDDTLESISDHDLSMTSPSVDETSEKPTSDVSLQFHKPNEVSRPSIKTFVPRFQPLVPKPGDGRGSANNPIVVTENSSPPRIAAASKRKRHSEPHRFMDRHSKLYTYRPLRTALAPKPANGSTFTGHKNHDVYRMMNAKLASMGWERNGEYNYDGEHGTQYPISQYSAQQHNTLNHAYVQYHHQPPARPYPIPQYSTGHHSIPQPPSEATLRQKASQYIRAHTYVSPYTRPASKDPEQDSTSKSAEHTVYKSPYHPHESKLNLFNNDNNNKNKNNTSNHLAHLTQQSALLAQLLECYPHSTDAAGLREDIRMLIAVQNQRIEPWIDGEVEREGKRRTTELPTASSPITRATQVTEQLRALKEKDDEIRGLLSAGASLWQDGSGMGVADVYAEGVERGGDGGGTGGPDTAREGGLWRLDWDFGWGVRIESKSKAVDAG